MAEYDGVMWGYWQVFRDCLLVQHQDRSEGPVTVLKLSADGRLLYTGGEDGTVKIWQLEPQP